MVIAKADVLDGEGDINYVWRHSARCTVQLRAAKQSMRILEVVSGNTVSSAAGVERIYFGTDGELTPPVVVLDLVAVATDSEAATPTRVYQQIVLFKCQVKFPDLQNRHVAPGEIVIDFDAYKSLKDENGSVIPSAVGQLRSGSTSLPA